MTRLERIDELCRLRSSLEDIVVPNYSNPLDIKRFDRQMRRYRDALSEVIDREVNNVYTVEPLPKPYEDGQTEEECNRRLCRENYAMQMESIGYDTDGNKK